MTKFIADVIDVDDSNYPEEPMVELKTNQEFDNDASDGCGIMSVSLASRWNGELCSDYSRPLCGCNLRNSFLKGMVFPFDIVAFAEQVNGASDDCPEKYLITDVWAVRSDGSGNTLLSYDVVDGMFESHQGKWSEAIYNEDGNRKSVEPFVNSGESIYLPMLQGKKEQHRKWWLYNRFRYKDSQFNTGSSMEKRITIRAHAQANIKLIAYVNMYGHVYYNAELAEHRMFRGQEYEFVWAATGAEDAVIGINDADMLTSLGDLAPLMVELIDISKATHLTALKVGDASESYVNNNLNSITLGNNVLLRTIDLRNCASLTQAVNASGCTGLEEAYFDGTAITGLTLPNGGNLKKLHLPGTVANLTLLNQTALTEFVMPGYSNITTLRLENNSSIIDPLAILDQMAANSRVRIIGFEKTVESAQEIMDFVALLDTMRGLDENGNNTDKPQVSGTIHVDSISSTELAEVQAKYPSITIDYSTLVSYLKFYNEDGTEILYTDPVENGGNGIYIGSEPGKESTAQYRYEFAGWSKTPGGEVDEDALAAVTADRSVYAVFTAILRTYTVTLYNYDGSVHAVRVVPYGSSVEGVADPVRPNASSAEDWAFIGWNPEPVNIAGNTDCVAQFKNTIATARLLVMGTLSGDYVNDRVTVVGKYAFGDNGLNPIMRPNSISFPNCVSLRDFAFTGSGVKEFRADNYTGESNDRVFSSSKVESVYMPNCTTIGSGMFRESSIKNMTFSPDLSAIRNDAFTSTSIEEFVYPKAKLMMYGVFNNCKKLKKVDIKGWDSGTNINNIFSNASALETLILRSTTLLTLNTSSLQGSAIEAGTGYVYVPKTLANGADGVETYRAATNWSVYAERIRAIEDYPEICGGE